MTTETEVGALIGLLGILSGLVGQALFWGIFRGSVTERLKSYGSRMDRHDVRLDDHDHRLINIDKRMVAVECSCQINHSNGEGD